jgi:hypothetical protein
LTIRAADPLDAKSLASPAKLAPTPVEYVPTLIPLNEALFTVATPLAFVVALPAPTPFKVNVIVLPLTGVPPLVKVRVAERFAVPPNVPLAGATVRVVAGLITARLNELLLVEWRESPP